MDSTGMLAIAMQGVNSSIASTGITITRMEATVNALLEKINLLTEKVNKLEEKVTELNTKVDAPTTKKTKSGDEPKSRKPAFDNTRNWVKKQGNKYFPEDKESEMWKTLVNQVDSSKGKTKKEHGSDEWVRAMNGALIDYVQRTNATDEDRALFTRIKADYEAAKKTAKESSANASVTINEAASILSGSTEQKTDILM